MNKAEFRTEMINLAKALIPEIGDEYRASEEDTEPSMQVTIGADAEGWNYQSGDNSFTGGAYGYDTWAVGYLYRNTDPEDFADSIIDKLEEAFDVEIFDEGSSM